jgi:hypothetical protein
VPPVDEPPVLEPLVPPPEPLVPLPDVDPLPDVEPPDVSVEPLLEPPEPEVEPPIEPEPVEPPMEPDEPVDPVSVLCCVFDLVSDFVPELPVVPDVMSSMRLTWSVSPVPE